MTKHINRFGSIWKITDGKGIILDPLTSYPDYLSARKALLPSVAPYRSLPTDNPDVTPSWLTPDQQAVWERTYQRILKLTGDAMKAWLLAMGMVKRQRQGMAVKAAPSPNDLLIGGWMILFGSPVFKDKVNTYFTPETDYGLEYYPTAPLWYHHGADLAYGGMPIGIREQAIVYPDIGIWGEHRVFADHPLFKRTQDELENGQLTHSSDTLEHFVRLGLQQDGALLLWFLAGCSVTKTPAEPGLGIVVQLEQLTEAGQV